MTENEKLEIIARAICGSNPDMPVTLNGQHIKNWKVYDSHARRAMAAWATIDAMEKNRQRTTAPNVLNVQRRIFLPESDDNSPIQTPAPPEPKVSKRDLQLD